MKLTITMATLLLAVAAPAVAKDEVVVQSGRKSFSHNVATQVFESCASRFIERAFPGQKIKYGTRLNIDDKMAHEAGALDYMVVTMQLQSKSDGAPLMTGTCTANRLGGVLDLAIRTTSQPKLAGLTINDVRLALVNR